MVIRHVSRIMFTLLYNITCCCQTARITKYQTDLTNTGCTIITIIIHISRLFSKYTKTRVTILYRSNHTFLLPIGIIPRTTGINRQTITHKKWIDHTTCPAWSTTITTKFHLQITGYPQWFIKFFPHYNLLIPFHILITEHGIIWIDRNQWSIHSFRSICILC